jgi:hypothetical protein
MKLLFKIGASTAIRGIGLLHRAFINAVKMLTCITPMPLNGSKLRGRLSKFTWVIEIIGITAFTNQ